MKIKHFVITRFLSSKTLGLGDKIFDETIIQNGINYVNSYFIPSLNNQTNKNFDIIFIVNDEHDIENSEIKNLNNIKTEIKYHILKNSEYIEFCKNESKGYDWLILTRMDYDDLVKNTAVEEIQTIISNNDMYDLLCYGYNTGYTMFKKNLYVFDKPGYNKYGYFSIFESLCIKINSNVDLFDIYFFNHTQLKKEVTNIGKSKQLKYLIPPESNSQDNFVWVRHENTGTELLSGVKAFNLRLKKLCPKPDNFKERFGIDI